MIVAEPSPLLVNNNLTSPTPKKTPANTANTANTGYRIKLLLFIETVCVVAAIIIIVYVHTIYTGMHNN